MSMLVFLAYICCVVVDPEALYLTKYSSALGTEDQLRLALLKPLILPGTACRLTGVSQVTSLVVNDPNIGTYDLEDQ